MLVTALVAACGGETIVVTSTGATTTSAPAELQVVIPDEPLVPHGSVDGVDHLFVAAAATVDETTHAYIVGFGPDRHQVIEMTWSVDGSAIQQRDPGVDDLGLDLAEPGHMPMSLSQEEDGTWTMIGFGVPKAAGAEPIFWHAVSDGPSGPWHDAAIVYEVGGPGAWDGAWIDFPTTFSTEGQRYMLYEGASDADRNASHLGIAASPDGIAWARPQTPALTPDDCPEVTSIRARDCCRPMLGGYLHSQQLRDRRKSRRFNSASRRIPVSCLAKVSKRCSPPATCPIAAGFTPML